MTKLKPTTQQELEDFKNYLRTPEGMRFYDKKAQESMTEEEYIDWNIQCFEASLIIRDFTQSKNSTGKELAEFILENMELSSATICAIWGTARTEAMEQMKYEQLRVLKDLEEVLRAPKGSAQISPTVH